MVRSNIATGSQKFRRGRPYFRQASTSPSRPSPHCRTERQRAVETKHSLVVLATSSLRPPLVEPPVSAGTDERALPPASINPRVVRPSILRVRWWGSVAIPARSRKKDLQFRSVDKPQFDQHSLQPLQPLFMFWVSVVSPIELPANAIPRPSRPH